MKNPLTVPKPHCTSLRPCLKTSAGGHDQHCSGIRTSPLHCPAGTRLRPKLFVASRSQSHHESGRICPFSPTTCDPRCAGSSSARGMLELRRAEVSSNESNSLQPRPALPPPPGSRSRFKCLQNVNPLILKMPIGFARPKEYKERSIAGHTILRKRQPPPSLTHPVVVNLGNERLAGLLEACRNPVVHQ